MLPDGRLASGLFSGAILIWDLGSGTCAQVLEEHLGVGVLCIRYVCS